jgi:DNA-binding winged helix-turn-helix (wHTH) protein
VDVAVARLRSALGSGRHIETVIKRGYRLRVDDREEGPAPGAGPSSARSAVWRCHSV